MNSNTCLTQEIYASRLISLYYLSSENYSNFRLVFYRLTDFRLMHYKSFMNYITNYSSYFHQFLVN